MEPRSDHADASPATWYRFFLYPARVRLRLSSETNDFNNIFDRDLGAACPVSNQINATPSRGREDGSRRIVG